MFNIIIDKNYDKSFGFGAEIYVHKHVRNFPSHLHFIINFGFWFVELQIGDDAPSEPKK
jgi:hypothetical protein